MTDYRATTTTGTMGAGGMAGAMAGDADKIRGILATGVRNAHSLEKEAIQLMERQIPRLDTYPELQARMRQHLEETRVQEERLDRMLDRMGDAPSTVKDMVMQVAANVAAAVHMPADDEILKNTFADLAFENYEIAAYRSLIAMAEACGATEERAVFEASLAEEEAMAEWLDAHVGQITRQYLTQTEARS